MKNDALICDIDGTLVNIDHRRHHVEGGNKDWNSFFAEMDKDIINPLVHHVVKTLYENLGYCPMLVTGRPAKYLDETRKWMHKHLLFPSALFMRGSEDFRPDHVVKLEIYEQKIKPNYNVKLVLDDRASVVKMWRELGLECWQVAEGNF